MSFLNCSRAAFNPRNFGWSFLWVAAPIVNTVSIFFFFGFLVRLAHSCGQGQYRVRYDDYGMLFVKGLFAAIIVLIYLLPGLIAWQFQWIAGVILFVIGCLLVVPALAHFSVTESFKDAFSFGAWQLLGRARFWIACFLWSVVAAFVAALIVVVGMAFSVTVAIPVFAVAVGIVVLGSFGAALIGHALR